MCTRDGILVCRHDLDLAPTTDVASRPEFAHKRRRLEVHGELVDSWFVQDFYLEELRELRARERWPKKRPGSAMYDELLGVITLEELLDLREQESARAGRQLGVHIELKHAAPVLPACGCHCTSRSSRSCGERRLDVTARAGHR